MRDLFVKDFYLKNGLIPVDGFSQEEIKSFHDKLKSLAPAERRRTKRKFRKFVRKMNLEMMERDASNNPTKISKRKRRREVHIEICHNVNLFLEEIS